MACAPSEVSDQPGHPLGAQCVAKDPRCHHVDSEDSAQADRSLRWLHSSFYWFYHEMASSTQSILHSEY